MHGDSIHECIVKQGGNHARPEPALLSLARSALSPASAPPLGEADAVGFRPVVGGYSTYDDPSYAVLGSPLTGSRRGYFVTTSDFFGGHFRINAKAKNTVAKDRQIREKFLRKSFVNVTFIFSTPVKKGTL
jgi:hypothetical protein